MWIKSRNWSSLSILQMDSFDLILFIVIIFFSSQPSTSTENCSTTCGNQTIHFPFRLIGRPDDCSCPGFNLSCQVQEARLLPILTLPHTGNFSVHQIDYTRQILRIAYSEGCTPRILLKGLNLSGLPFMPAKPKSYSFFNCSTDEPMVRDPRVTKIPCLSGRSFYVVYRQTDILIPTTSSTCSEIAKVLASPIDLLGDLNDGIALTWTQPDCSLCGYNQNGYSKSALYRVLIGVGIPLLCVVGIIVCHSLKSKEQHNHPSPSPEILLSAIAPPSTDSTAAGLHRRTIEEYPVTLLGQSRRLPNPNDNICSICLCEYQPEEMIRIIPNCNHYFHVSCIDEWLSLKATCPMCRSSGITPTLASLSSSRSSITFRMRLNDDF